MNVRKFRHLALIFLLALPVHMEAAKLNTISSEDGLSNNAILSIHQNDLGHLYIGTPDGLNIWDGHSMRVFTASDGCNYFFGNMIWNIFPYTDNELILHTNHGVACLDTWTHDVKFYDELALLSKMAIDKEGNFLMLKRDNSLCFFDPDTRKISIISQKILGERELCQRMTVMDDGRLCIFTDKDIYVISLGKDYDGTLYISEISNMKTRCRYVSHPYFDSDGEYYLVVSDDKISRFDSDECRLDDISIIRSLPDDYLSGVVPSDEGYYISFVSQGVYFLPEGEDQLQTTDIDFGVFSMISDRNQPIIWIGTDCNGLIKYTDEPQPVTCLTYDMFPHQIKMPVRSVHVDKERTLWFGTKGDGIFRIPDFDGEVKYGLCQKSDTHNSALNDNSVYTITEGSKGILWIGTEGRGLNSWSYRSKRIEKVRGSEALSRVHSIIELNDSTLWVGTDKMGVYKCSYMMRNGTPVITESQLVQFCEPFDEATSVFAMKMQDDSTIWVSSRGQGVLVYNLNTNKSRVIKLPTDNGFAINETFYIAKSDRMLFATGNGLMTYCPASDSVNVSDFVPKKATHGIICDDDKNIWVSTNSGIVSLDSLYNYRLSYDRFSGVKVLEYSDGACYFDEPTHQVIFGGINGLTIINSKDSDHSSASSYIPDIDLTYFIQNDKFSHLSPMLDKGKLELPFSKSIFGIAFSVVDHLNYSNYEFKYNIEGYNSDWVTNNNNSNIIYLPSLSPGKYKLKILYINKATRYQSEECVLPIYINPPFYKTWCAYCFYLLVAALCIFLIIRSYRRKYALAQEKMRKKYSEKITSIAQETTSAINESLSVQLTFIIGLCQQIRAAAQNNAHVADKVKMVEYNIAKISKTLHTFNEYKSITETLIKAGKISLISVNQTMAEVLDIVQASTTTRNVKIACDIEEGIAVALNKEAFLTMLYSLIYKVISTAKGDKVVNLHIEKEASGNLLMMITLSSDRETYESMYAMTEYSDGILVEGGYDVDFCRRLISMMAGKLDVSFIEETQTVTLDISLPSQDVVPESGAPVNSSSIQEGITTYNTIIENLLPKNFKREASFDHIYIISNKREISSFLGYFLSDSYNVSSFTDNDAAMAGIEKLVPTAVIYDVGSMSDRFVDFLERIKGNRRMQQATLVTLTSSLQTSERELYIELGADLCISFPFNMTYLRSALKKLLQKKKTTVEFYNSPMSKFVLNDGKIIHQADKEFFDKVLQIIDENISNPELTAQMVAQLLGTSTRAMYRRLENITDNKLHQMIREARMNVAVSLLTSSKLTVDEIMYKVGYDNRSTFYRSFKAIYGKTPKEYREDIHSGIVDNFKS